MVGWIEVYGDEDAGFRWRAKGANGETVASGESYTRRSDCTEAVEGLFPEVELRFVEAPSEEGPDE